jgi:hypothetical protein
MTQRHYCRKHSIEPKKENGTNPHRTVGCDGRGVFRTWLIYKKHTIEKPKNQGATERG